MNGLICVSVSIQKRVKYSTYVDTILPRFPDFWLGITILERLLPQITKKKFILFNGYFHLTGVRRSSLSA